ncbi:hypothetical protein RYX36_016728 [Vicia faba]
MVKQQGVYTVKNNEIYNTDEFRMYSFKVKPCLRTYFHEWTECPFVHPGETARRRDPNKYNYSCLPCPEFQKGGSCSKGDACEYAHGVFECWLHPAHYRTKFCNDKVGCTRKVCFFAHNPEELRPVYASTGSGLPLPTSYSSSTFPIYPFTVNALQPAWKPPLTPSVASPHAAGTEWQIHAAVPTFQMLQLEYLFMWKLMIDEMASLAGVNHTNTNFEGIFRSQIPSLTSMQVHQNRGYPADLINSNVVRSPQIRVDPSVYPRYDAFSKRSHSERPSTSSAAMEPSTTFPGWGSPATRS